ncbi:unnamed protein product, partial [Medioppia subpectinata]
IRKCNEDGSDPQILVYEDIRQPNCLAIDFTTQTIMSSAVETVVKSKDNIDFVRIIHSSKQKSGTDYCKDTNCEHICVPNGKHGYRCVCPHNQTCSDNNTTLPTLQDIPKQTANITALSAMMATDEPLLMLTAYKRDIRLARLSTDTIYFNKYMGINAVNMSSASRQLFPIVSQQKCVTKDIGVDPLAALLFWSEYIDTSPRNPMDNYNEIQRKCRIMRSTQDGRNVRVLLRSEPIDRHSLNVDINERRLYWIGRQNVSYEGNDRRVHYRTNNIVNNLFTDIYAGYLYWAEERNYTIMRAPIGRSKLSTSELATVAVKSGVVITGLKVWTGTDCTSRVYGLTATTPVTQDMFPPFKLMPNETYLMFARDYEGIYDYEIKYMAYDWVHNSVYISYLKGIEVFTLSDNMYSYDVITHFETQGDVAVDPLEGLLVWSQWTYSSVLRKYTGRIMSANLDGSDVQVINNNTEIPTILSIDIKTQTVYWIDKNMGSVNSMDYFGGNLRQILVDKTLLKSAYFMDVFDGYIFWSNSDGSGVHRTDGNTTDTAVLSYTAVQGVRVLDASRQPNGTDSCANHNCTQLCLPVRRDSYRCVCPKNMGQIINKVNTNSGQLSQNKATNTGSGYHWLIIAFGTN